MLKKSNGLGIYIWTRHALTKMRHYGIAESRIKRIIRYPKRIEEGIAPNTIAVMQPSSIINSAGKSYWKQEIWVMYQAVKRQSNLNSWKKSEIKTAEKKIDNFSEWLSKSGATEKIKIITAWRYPGISPNRNPVPKEIISEAKSLLEPI